MYMTLIFLRTVVFQRIAIPGLQLLAQVNNKISNTAYSAFYLWSIDSPQNLDVNSILCLLLVMAFKKNYYLSHCNIYQ